MTHPPGIRTMVDLLESRAADQPNRVGYLYLLDGEDREESLAYGELASSARRIAARLQEQFEPGERALLLYPPGLDFVKGLFGCFYAGLVAVPAYPPDPFRMERSVPRLQGIAADADARVALTSDPVLGLRDSIVEQAPELADLAWVATDDPVGDPGRWRFPEVDGDALAVLQYTSGSTSLPKGVVLDHENLLLNLASIAAHGSPVEGERAVIWLPQFHDFGLFEGTLWPVYASERPRVLMSPIAFLQRPFRWLRAISRYRATISGGPNFAYELCRKKVTPAQKETLDLSCWQMAFSGAEPVRSATLDRFVEAFAPCGFERKALYPCYGLAEATLAVAGAHRGEGPRVRRVDRTALEGGAIRDAASPGDAAELVSSGVAIPDLTIRIVDLDTRTALPDGRVGEIWVRSRSLGRGYWRRPAETEETFRAHIEPTEEGPFLRTGDLGFLDGEELYVTGRLKDAIVVRGRNLYPQDIEQVVHACHPAVRPGSGAAVPIDAGGEEGVAIVQEVYEDRLDHWEPVMESIRREVADAFGVQVHAVLLLRPGGIPKTSSGKIQRHACERAVRSGGLPVVAESRRGRQAAA